MAAARDSRSSGTSCTTPPPLWPFSKIPSRALPTECGARRGHRHHAAGRAGRTPGPLTPPGELHDVRLRAHLACLSGVRPQGPRSARHRPFTARAGNNAARYPPRVNRTVGSFSEKPTIVRRASAAQACGPPRARRPAVIPGSELPGIAAAGHHPRRPGAATRTWPAAIRRPGAAETCPRQRDPGGSGLEVP
jgi:hypothetical protein